MEQPKDYAEMIVDKMLEDAFAELAWYQKLWMLLANNLFLTIASSLTLGYLAGMTFGKFW